MRYTPPGAPHGGIVGGAEPGGARGVDAEGRAQTLGRNGGWGGGMGTTEHMEGAGRRRRQLGQEEQEELAVEAVHAGVEAGSKEGKLKHYIRGKAKADGCFEKRQMLWEGMTGRS